MEMKVGEELESKFLLTHTLTHTGKGLYGNNGAKSAADLILLEQKWSESLENQGPEGSQSVGKDEVGSSNLPSSSKETRSPARDSGFLVFLLPWGETRL